MDPGNERACDGEMVRRCDGAMVRWCDGATVRLRDCATGAARGRGAVGRLGTYLSTNAFRSQENLVPEKFGSSHCLSANSSRKKTSPWTYALSKACEDMVCRMIRR
ncbi:MAG: hypothetical protein ABGY24_15225 [bacterium]